MSSHQDRRFRACVGGLLETGQYADAKIECEGNIFRVHKAIICPQSAYFAHAFDSKNGFKEAGTSTIVLHEISPDTVRAIIQYLYHGQYTYPSCKYEKLTLIVNVYLAADMYQLPALKVYSREKFRDFSIDIFTLEAYPTVLKTIYEDTMDHDRGLRDIVVKTAVLYIGSLVQDTRFDTTLSEVAGFGKDLVYALQKALGRKSGM